MSKIFSLDSSVSQYYYGDKVENYSWATTYTILWL